jgi:carbonic anhydrase/acetyltransferase-like protein (isoleucine patch superfamily)
MTFQETLQYHAEKLRARRIHLDTLSERDFVQVGEGWVHRCCKWDEGDRFGIGYEFGEGTLVLSGNKFKNGDGETVGKYCFVGEDNQFDCTLDCGDGCTIADYNFLSGSVIVGNNCIIGNYNTIGAPICASTQVVMLHDSAIGDRNTINGVDMEKWHHTRIGSDHTEVGPAARIGNDCFVQGGAYVDSTPIPDKSVVFVKGSPVYSADPDGSVTPSSPLVSARAEAPRLDLSQTSPTASPIVIVQQGTRKLRRPGSDESGK